MDATTSVPAAIDATATAAPKPAPKIGAKGETAPNGMKKIIIGVCAMQRKANSKPMRAIMSKILEYYQDWLSFVIFPEDVIMNEPVEKWPLCDCLISFHATDFPLYKAIEYERLRRPYVINDLHRQYDLLDRRKVFRALARAGIGHPRHCVVIRDKDGNVEGGEVHEAADSIEVNGMVFNKPFVEKPVSAEDHNVYIYYPSSVGGGSQRLFRKINDRSSWYSPVSHIRREGSYIYEEFIPADGTDVKVYAVGPFYAHAEARKAPGLDGKVDRDSDGKEVRYPVILSAKEKMIARRVVCAFGQTVCGFDLLRANGMSFVCDVNGFSFVKTSTKYYEDTAKILGNTILRRLASCLSIPWHIPFQDDDPPLVSTPSGKLMELRCVIAVIRHGDRTPKQKMKLVINDERFFALFHKYDGKTRKEIKMKRPNQLMEVLELCRVMLTEALTERDGFIKQINAMEAEEAKPLERKLDKIEDNIKKWDQMRTVLEMYGHFSGINRKVQLKYLKPKTETDDETRKKPSLMLIMKWGGELTTAGVLQAEALGKLFRTLYPGIRRTDGKECPEDTQGLGFLRLHSTYRHDLKIYSSDEGRVQMTAAAFAKGMLALEGELTPIMMQMVKSSNTDGLLNDDYNAKQFQNDLKGYLHQALQVDRDFTPEDYSELNPSGLRSIANAMEFIKNPRKMCHEIAGYVQRMVEIIRWHKLNNPHKTLYLNESWELAESRWGKELREFRKNKKDADGNSTIDFDISKIPDIYDNIKYDMEHNPELGINNEGEFERMYLCVKNMADIVVPQEYGISEESKISIAQRVCTPLLGKLRNDLHRCVQNPEEGDESQTRLDPRASEGIATPMRHVRTRLYFTSESHIHTLMNLIRYGALCSPDDKKWQRAMNFLSGVTEFNYMTQVVMMVYEDSRNESDKQGMDRFHIELLFSPGLYPCFQTEKERIYETRFNSNKSKMTHQVSTSKPSSTSSRSNNGGGSPAEPATVPVTEEPSAPGSSSGSTSARRESISKATHDNFIRSKSTDSGTAAAKLSPRSAQSSAPWIDGSSPNTTTDRLKAPPITVSFRSDGGSSNGSSSSVNTTPNDVTAEGDDRRTHESDDELLTDHSVNLVVLSEVNGTGDIGRHHSPPNRKRHTTVEVPAIVGAGGDAANASVPSVAASATSGLTPLIEQKAPQIGLMKSMSDVSCNRRAKSESVDPMDPLPDNDDFLGATANKAYLLEENQATVGSGRGKWAKELVEGTRVALGKPSKHSDNPEHRRPYASEVFARGDVIVMKRTESRDDSSDTSRLQPPGSLPTTASTATIASTASTTTCGGAEDAASGNGKRSRFPYRFKHHTVNLLTGRAGVENRLISTDVLTGRFMDSSTSKHRKHINNSAVLSTAVIARSSSAPRLQTFTSEEEISVTEIRRFWPPLRSLETMHDNIAYKQLDSFFEQILNSSTPLPSPPKTPVHPSSHDIQMLLDSRMKNTIARLKAMDA
uniref:Inositol hexakisphosphate and diphosphoinositol-pentakisphosphate kinase n=1 Tax=Panagrellus redivivus TaxID=6233 RepID=A0A7E4V0P5_PANRE